MGPIGTTTTTTRPIPPIVTEESSTTTTTTTAAPTLITKLSLETDGTIIDPVSGKTINVWKLKAKTD